MVENVVNKKKNSINGGFTLIELIVAMAIGAIVAGTIATLISISIRFYSNESVNTAMQYEIQTNLNQITDAIMGAQGMVIVQNPSGVTNPAYTDYAAFGNFTETRNSLGVVTAVTFDGVVFVSGVDSSTGKIAIYMDRVTGKTGANAIAAVTPVVNTIKSSFGASPLDPNPYLLGQYATQFKIEPKITATSPTVTYASFYTNDAGETKYVNPIVISIELDFEKDGTGKTIHKHVKDEIYMRNEVKADMYFGVAGAETCYTYSKKK